MTDHIAALADLITENAERVIPGTTDASDVGFFSIRLREGSDLTAVKLKNAIVRAETGVGDFVMSLPDFLSQEGAPGPSYTQLGVWLGDQGIALAFMGLGEVLGLWKVITPLDTGITDKALFERMLGMGFVHISVPPESLIARKAAEA